MKKGQRATLACASLVALILLAASSPLGGYARPALLSGIQPDSPTLKHYAVSAAAFTPSGGGSYQNRHDGCVWASTGTNVFFAPLLLPEGSTIKFVTMFFRDVSASDLVEGRVTIIQQNPVVEPTVATVVDLFSSDGGYGSVTSSELDLSIDMSSNFYQLRGDLQAYLSTNMLCGFRIDYIPPSIFALALPHIAR